MIFLKSPQQIETMNQANLIVHSALDIVEKNIKPGMTTEEIDALVETEILRHNAKPAFKGYKGFKHATCISVNEIVVHGVPDKRIIQDGDIIGVDVGVLYNGFFGDAARTLIVGNTSPEIKKLVEETKRALYAGIEQMREGNRLYDINAAIEKVAKENKYGIVKGLCGHGIGGGIGGGLHEKPNIFNYVEFQEPNVRLHVGMVFALEPMFALGKPNVEILDDGWTVQTKDKSIAAHQELSIAITKNGYRILGK